MIWAKLDVKKEKTGSSRGISDTTQPNVREPDRNQKLIPSKEMTRLKAQGTARIIYQERRSNLNYVDRLELIDHLSTLGLL